MALYSDKIFVSKNYGNDGYTGRSWALPYLTINHALNDGAITTAEIYLSNGSFSEDIDISGSSATNVVVIGTDKTTFTINSWVGNNNYKILFKNMNIVINAIDGGNRNIMFDNCDIIINGGCDNYPIFYHSDLQINNTVLQSLFVSCDVIFDKEQYWYEKQDYLFYNCKYYIPAGFNSLRTQVFTPLCDKIHIEPVIQDILGITKSL